MAFLVFRSSPFPSLISSNHRRCPQPDCHRSQPRHALLHEIRQLEQYLLRTHLTVSANSRDRVRSTRYRSWRGYRAPHLVRPGGARCQRVVGASSPIEYGAFCAEYDSDHCACLQSDSCQCLFMLRPNVGASVSRPGFVVLC